MTTQGKAKPERQIIGSLLALVVLAGCGAGIDGSAGSAAQTASPVTDDAAFPVDATEPNVLGRVAATATVPTTVEVTTTVPAPPPTEPPTTAPPPTEPPTTAPPPTEPPTTAAPVTAAPVTAPPATEPPPTVPAQPASAQGWDGAAADDLLWRLNGERAAAGLGPLSWSGSLAGSGRGQVDAMIAQGSLFHQDLQDDLNAGWMIVGENVGYGPGSAAIHSALVNSARHYENLVHSRYTHVGIAAKVDVSGRMWISQVFGG